MRYFQIITISAALLISQPAQAASIYVSYTGNDTVGQQVAYQLREAIQRSARHDLVYREDDAGFVIALVTVEIDKYVSTAYSASLTMPQYDKKGFNYFITSLAGYCGAARATECAQNILSGVDPSINDVVEALNEAFRNN